MSLLNFSRTVGDNSVVESLSGTQLWLSRGIVWYYGFNHEEAIVCFQNALKLDENCVMAHFGISISHAPNYNTETMNRDTFPSAKDAYEHCHTALRLIQQPDIRAGLSEIEIALVEALECRFDDVFSEEYRAKMLQRRAQQEAEEGEEHKTEHGPIEAEPVEQNTDAYAEAMRLVYNRYPADANIACTYAEALLNKSPWVLWDLDSGEPKAHAVIARGVIEKALLLAPNHPGLNHFYVHLMEMSPTPELALPACAVLRKYCPSAGHLIHMPSHIYVLLGMWREAVQANEDAAAQDREYVRKEGIYNYYTGYRIHNLHFIAYAAMVAGELLVVDLDLFAV